MRFGDAVKIDYVDLADAEGQARYADLLALVEDGDLPYPLVAINGQLRLAGTAHFYQVLPYVEEALQTEATMSEA
jgi:disulfide oxidoreductase YuzD